MSTMQGEIKQKKNDYRMNQNYFKFYRKNSMKL
jgi:hypothetical protein